MKVHVDQTKCTTAGKCVQISPKLFRFAEGSKKAVPFDSEVPSALEEQCIAAAMACPSRAIVIDFKK